MKKSLLILAAAAAFVTVQVSAPAFATPIALGHSVVASHSALTEVKAGHKSKAKTKAKHKKHKSTKKAAAKTAAKTTHKKGAKVG